MGLMDRLRAAIVPAPLPSIATFWPYMNMAGVTYPLGLQQTLLGREEGPAPGYAGLVQWAYSSNPIVFAVEQVRVQLFAEAKFKFRYFGSGQLRGDSSLRLLERPWPNGVTADLLQLMLLDADLAGDSFILRTGSPPTLRRLRPDWVTVITAGDPWMTDAVAYAYQPGGPARGREPVLFDVGQVAHFVITHDPLSPHRGTRWLDSVIREIAADIAMTEHKASFLRNGATPNMVVSLDPAISKEAFDRWVETFQKAHRGARNAYETMFLGGGAKAEVVGKDLQQLDFKLTQGAGETRIAAAANVPPVVAGLSEGLQAATYSNYAQARRRFADQTMRPAWRNVCGSLQTVVEEPVERELWYDDAGIAALQVDLKERAEILSLQMGSIKTGTDAGWEPDAAVSAVTSWDLSSLKGSHTGLYSVQLQPPQPEAEPPTPEPTAPAEAPNPEDMPMAKAGRAIAENTALMRSLLEREQPQPVIHVYPVELPAPVTNVTIEQPAITVESPDITVEPSPIAISVEPTPVEIHNDVSVEPTPVEVTVEAPEPRSVTKRVVRDSKNQIVRIVEEPD